MQIPQQIHAHLGFIEVTGIDAQKFLQGQVTCDVREVTMQQSRLGAYCNHQGRVQATFRLFQLESNYYLLLPRSMVSSTLALLQKYAIFSKVTLTNATDTITISQIPGDQAGSVIPLNIDAAAWELGNILAGIATIYPETVGLFTPHMLNYDKLNAISFNKGCYMGQEIVARTQYLGKAKQHLYHIQLPADQTPHPGNPIFTDAQEQAGTIVNTALDTDGNYQVLAVLQDALKAALRYSIL